MYRNGAYAGLLANPNLPEIVDFFIYIHLASQGGIGVINEDLGEYTVGTGISTKNNLYKLVQEALAYAVKLGLSKDDYCYAFAKQNLMFAEKALFEKDDILFKHLIKLSYDSCRFSLRQRFVYTMKNNISLLRFGARIYRYIKYH